VIFKQSLGKLHQLTDLLDIVFHDVEHPHLCKVQRLRKLVLRLLDLLVRHLPLALLLSLLAIVVKFATLQLLPVVSHFLQVFRLELMQRLQVVLLDIVIKGIFKIGHLFQGFPTLHK
jgi:hypothetical protein